MTTRSDTEGRLREALTEAIDYVESGMALAPTVVALPAALATLRAALATPPDTDPSGLDVGAAWDPGRKILARNIAEGMRADWYPKQDVDAQAGFLSGYLGAYVVAHEAAIQESRAGGGLREAVDKLHRWDVSKGWPAFNAILAEIDDAFQEPVSLA